MEFSKSQRGNTVLTYLGFEYSRFRENKTTGVISWRCRQYKSSSCKASIKTNGDSIVGGPSSHSHDSCPHKAKANIAMSKMKEGIKHVGATARNVIGNEIIGLDSDILAHLPKQSSIARNLLRHRKSSNLPNPNTPDFSIPEKYTELILHDSIKPDPDSNVAIGDTDSSQTSDKDTIYENGSFDKLCEDSTLEFSKSQRGNTVLTYLGFEYNRFRENKEAGIITWRCRRHKSSGCKAFIKTNGENIIGALSSHSHDSCPHKAKANIAMSKMKESIKHVGATTRSVIVNEIIGLNSDILAHLPKQSSITRNLLRHRKNSHLPNTRTPDFYNPEKYADLIFHDSEEDDPDRILAIEYH